VDCVAKLHLLAISGLNITLVAGFLYFTLRLSGIFPRKLNAFLVLILSIFYTFLAGGNPPVLRAGIMATILLVGICMERENYFANSLLISFFVLTIVKPTDLFTPSFQLSFVAVLALVIGIPKKTSTPQFSRHLGAAETLNHPAIIWMKREIMQNLAASGVTFLGLAPIILYYFNIVSPIGFLANLVATPLLFLANISLLPILPLSFLSFKLASFLSIVPVMCFKVTCRVLFWLSKIPGGYFYLPSPKIYQIVTYYSVFLFILLFRRKRIRRTLGLLAASLTLIILLTSFLKERAFQMTCLDIGRSDVLFVSFPNQTNSVVISVHGNSAGQSYWTLKPFLMKQGIRQIDHLFILASSKSTQKWLKVLKDNFILKQIYTAPRAKILVDKNTWIEPVWIKEKWGSQYHEICAGFKFASDGTALLYMLNTRRKVLESISKQDDLKSVILYLPPINQVIDEPEKKFLASVSPHFLFHNQRKDVETFEDLFHRNSNISLFSIARLGSIALEKTKRRMKISPFLSKAFFYSIE